MADLSIEDLLAGLQAAQDAKSTIKLSERNIVELVNKLKSLGLLDDVGILHTVNGKEYITRERVQGEVAGAVRQAGGRIELADLPALVGVDLLYCEAAAQAICAASKGETHLLQGELITTQYFDNLAMEVDGELQEAGVVALSDLARRNHLSSELVQSNMSARLGRILRGRMEGGLLYTQAYVSRVKAQLRGALRGSMAPTLIPDLLARLAQQAGSTGSEADPKLIASIVEELIRDGEVKGVVKGGGTSWVPDIYKSAQAEAIRRFYEQNSYLDYEHAAKMGLSSAKGELAGMLPGGIALHGAIVSPTLLLHLEASVDEALGSGSWLDVQPMLPPVLSVEDAAALLGRCSAVKAAAGSGKSAVRVLAATCAFSGEFLKEVSERYAEEAREAARQTAAERRSAASKASASALDTGATGGGKGGKGGGKAVKGGAAAQEEDGGGDDDGDWNMGPKKGKKGKGGKKGGGKAAAPAPGGGKGTKGGADGADKDAVSRLRAPTVAKIAECLAEWYPELAEPAGESEMLAEEVAAEVLPSAVAAYEAALSAAFTAGSEDRRRRRDEFAKLLEAAAANLHLFGKGAAQLAGEEAGVAVHRHVLRTVAPEAVDLLLQYEELQLDEVELRKDPKPEAPLSAGRRKAILGLLPPDLRESAAALVDSLNAATVPELQTCLDAAAEAAGLRLRKPDKKAEKAALADFQAKLRAQLAGAADPAEALALAVPLLFARATGKMLAVPGKAITGVLSELQGELEEEALALVTEFHVDVVAYIRAKSEEGGPGLLAALTARLPALKAACGLQDSSE